MYSTVDYRLTDVYLLSE